MSKIWRRLSSLLVAAALFCVQPAAWAAELIKSYPLDISLFTQGLEMVDERLLLSSGLYGQSRVGEIDLDSGQLKNVIILPDWMFAEGITATPAGIWLLSWREEVAFLLNHVDLSIKGRACYSGQGWGLCFDGKHLIMSNGSSFLSIRDAGNFKELSRLQVLEHGQPVELLNELEYANGVIYANVWQSNFVLKIDPESGLVLGRIDLTFLFDLVRSQLDPQDKDAVLNGIAHIEGERFFVTGKRWPLLFEVKLP